MADLIKQCVCVSFYLIIRRNLTETFEALKVAVGEQRVGRTQAIQWLSKFNLK